MIYIVCLVYGFVLNACWFVFISMQISFNSLYICVYSVRKHTKVIPSCTFVQSGPPRIMWAGGRVGSTSALRLPVQVN